MMSLPPLQSHKGTDNLRGEGMVEQGGRGRLWALGMLPAHAPRHGRRHRELGDGRNRLLLLVDVGSFPDVLTPWAGDGDPHREGMDRRRTLASMGHAVDPHRGGRGDRY